jgi:long-chain fatty acid transport protein
MRPSALGLAAAISLGGASAAASPEDVFGYGARTSAMGATGAAHATGAETAYHDPALASTIRAPKLTLGYGGATFALDGAGSRVRAQETAAKGIYVGAAAPIPFGGALADRVGLALALYTPSDVVVRARVLYPETPQFPLLADRTQSVTIRGALGVEVGYGLKVGIGFAALAEVTGTVTTSADATGRAATRVDNQLVATYAPTIGLAYAPPGSPFRVGATFRGKLDARFDVLVDATKLSTLPVPLFDIAGTAGYDPPELALEVARALPLSLGALPVRTSSVLAAQVVYERWRDFPGIVSPTVACSEGGPGACGIVPPAIAWRDAFALRLGAEDGFELAPGVVVFARGGAFLVTSPLPSDLPSSDAFDVATKNVVHVPTRYFDATRLAFTGGFGVAWGPFEVDTFVQLHTLLGRTDVAGAVRVFGLTGGVRF